MAPPPMAHSALQPPIEQARRALHAGRLAETTRLCLALLERDPAHCDALHLSGIAAYRSGALDDAQALIGRALELRPRSAGAWNDIGLVLRARGKTDAALQAFRAALAIDNWHAEAHGNFGMTLREQGQVPQALLHLRQALRIEPLHVPALVNLGCALRASAEPEEAERCLRKAKSIEPNHTQARAQLGCVLLELGRHAEAIEELRAGLATAHDPERAEILSVLSVAHRIRGETAEALACGRAAIALNPALGRAHNNLGHALSELGEIDAALAAYDAALAIEPDYRLARWNRSLLKLAMGGYGEGWHDYRLNPNVAYPAGTDLGEERLPEDLRGRRLCITRNQGIGDEIFFLRFAAMAEERGAQIAYRTEPRMAALLSRLCCIDEFPALDAAHPDASSWILLDHLPFLLGHSEGDAAPPSIRIEPGEQALARAAARLAAAGPAPYLGVTWRAGGSHAEKRAAGERGVTLEKRVPIEQLARAMSDWNGTVLILQRRPARAEIETFLEACTAPASDLSDVNEDLETLLALLARMDEYVALSNTNVHLRYAAGRDSRVLVPWFPEWRWGLAGRFSAWFPGCPTYRQGIRGDWSGALEALRTDLADTRSMRGAQRAP